MFMCMQNFVSLFWLRRLGLGERWAQGGGPLGISGGNVCWNQSMWLAKIQRSHKGFGLLLLLSSLWPEKYYILLLSLFISLRSLPTHRLSSKENPVIVKVKSLDSFIAVVRL